MSGVPGTMSMSTTSVDMFSPRERKSTGLRVRDERTIGDQFSSVSFVSASASASSELLSEVVRNLVGMIRNIRLEVDEATKVTPAQVSDVLAQMVNKNMKQAVGALMRISVPQTDNSIVQQFLRDIDSMDLEREGYLVPTKEARDRVLEMSDLLSAVFGSTIGAAAQPWTMSPLENGGLLPEWRGPRGDLEIHVGPDGQLAYVLVTEPDDEREYTGGQISSSKEVLRLISQILDA